MHDVPISPPRVGGVGGGPNPAKKLRQIGAAFAAEAAASPPPPPPQQQHAPGAGARVPLATRNLTKGQLDDMYTSCLKLATENKITTNNSWSLQFIDHLSEFVIPGGREEETNFQRASVTLDAGVKIYCLRVDSVHTETHRILRQVTRGGGNKAEEEAEAEGDEGEEGAGDGEKGAKKRQRKLLKADPSATLERPENLNVKKFDLAFAVDPLFKKTSAQFDAGGARGLLLNNLSVYRGTHVMFDSCDRPGEAKATPPPAGPEFLSLRGDLAKAFKDLPASAVEGARLAPGIEEIEQLLGPATPDPLFRATAQDLVERGRQEALRQAAELPKAPRRVVPNGGAAHPLAVTDQAPTAEEMRVQHGAGAGVGVGAEVNVAEGGAAAAAVDPLAAPVDAEEGVGAAPVVDPRDAADEMQVDEEPAGMPDHAPAPPPVDDDAYEYEGGGGDYEYGGGGEGSFDEGPPLLDPVNDDDGAEGPGLRVADAAAVPNVANLEEQEAVRKRDEAIAWLSGQYQRQKTGWQGGGALRARVQPPRRRAEAPQAGIEVEGEEEERGRWAAAKKGRRKPLLGALDYENLGELDESAFLAPGPGKSIVLKTMAAVNTLLPKDYDVRIPDLTRLFLRPRGFVTARGDGNLQGAEAVAAGIGFDLDMGGNPLGEGLQDDDDDDDRGAENYDYEGGGAMDDYGDLAGGYVNPAGEGVEDGLIAPQQLAQAVRKVQTVQVNYARISKQVDVRALKEELWNGISNTASRQPAKGSTEAEQAGVLGAEDGAASISFRDLLATVPEGTKAGRLEDLSVHLNFICLLHLANEKGLYIRDNDRLDDLVITNVPQKGQGGAGAGTPGARRE